MSPQIIPRLNALAQISADEHGLTRLFMTPEQARASALVAGWMREAGMTTRIDAVGNVIGRIEGARPGLPALLLGSHLDTVRDAGRYDGMLGVVTAIACLEGLDVTQLPFAIEIIGFSDEEGTRFGATLLGSRAVAGTFDSTVLDRTDDQHISMRAAFTQAGFDPDAIASAARAPTDIAAYVELHIEQGPVLEARGLPVGCVTAINGATRYELDLTGMAGHAGTVPMGARADALAAAAACILAVEARCAEEPDLVGTVGRIEVPGGAINVIPGRARFTLDIRAPRDAARQAALADCLDQMAMIAQSRRVHLRATRIYDAPAAPSAPWLMAQIDAAIAACGITPHHLPSGAGHDGLAIAAIADIGMIFLRCAGGISHNPAESITPDDAATGARVLRRFITDFVPPPAAGTPRP